MTKLYHERQQAALQDALPMWVVCRPTTSDFEGYWVARMHVTLPTPTPTDLLILGETLESVRDQLPADLINIGREPSDQDVIEEVWI